jgi:hypothetical protein
MACDHTALTNDIDPIKDHMSLLFMVSPNIRHTEGRTRLEHCTFGRRAATSVAAHDEIDAGVCAPRYARSARAA